MQIVEEFFVFLQSIVRAALKIAALLTLSFHHFDDYLS